MGFEFLRLLALAACWLAAGALARNAGPAARDWVGVGLLLVAGLGLAWPMAKAHLDKRLRPQQLPPEPALSPDNHRLNLLQAQLEHLPVAAWALGCDGRLQALSARARRLAAPGAVRDPAALQRLLRGANHSGPQTLETERGSERWALQRQTLSLDGQAQTLLVLLPLENQLETESLLAWQQLVQILTHEIMNSLTPIKSLSQTAQMLLDEPPLVERDLRLALDGIAQRAEGLSSFVATYRRVSHWPAPVLAPVDLTSLLQRLRLAAAPAWLARGGELSVEVAEPGLRLLADEGQLEQVLLALISNAEQATAEVAAPRLWLQARQGRGGRLQISVRDNGPGVPAGLERKIFLPFFSAREGGQGIGLTVVRQLLHGMGGRVRLVRPLDGGAAFVLSF
ncbi:sensor histidine kinase [Roseateles oligotrophus]|uniref:histidine kinase n=1 Tax=Roseateles oligotrophus TaxID=1769250 RepID=A0ABT2YJZ4_9BURK|nr:ATP-binding protein [Roseateles oligotrophus]MCV2370385.1 ATP-binding protein [Roseateles oligotrophus]